MLWTMFVLLSVLKYDSTVVLHHYSQNGPAWCWYPLELLYLTGACQDLATRAAFPFSKQTSSSFQMREKKWKPPAMGWATCIVPTGWLEHRGRKQDLNPASTPGMASNGGSWGEQEREGQRQGAIMAPMLPRCPPHMWDCPWRALGQHQQSLPFSSRALCPSLLAPAKTGNRFHRQEQGRAADHSPFTLSLQESRL